ncbi:MAG: methyltransferase [Deltaproteobacteria bacterium]|nr:methyltransferase [Deltaproteobacteria bacterium]
MAAMPPDDQEETIDAILGGRLRIIQKKKGYRFSIDALLLAHFVELREESNLLDLGTGSGIIALILGSRNPRCQVLGIDVQEEIAAMAGRSVALNGLTERVAIRQGDARCPGTFCQPRHFDAVVCNPPYRRLASGRMNPHPGKALARHEIAGTVGDFLAAAAFALKDGGRVTTIYPATRLVELLMRMRSVRLEPKRMQIVHSRPGGNGEFVLLEGVKGGREALRVLPPLCIYGEGRGYGPEMAAIFQSLAAFPADAGDRSPWS